MFNCINSYYTLPGYYHYFYSYHVIAVIFSFKAMTHQPTQLLSQVGLGPVGICVMGLQLNFFLHSSLIPDCLVGSGPTYDSTVELGDVSWH